MYEQIGQNKRRTVVLIAAFMLFTALVVAALNLLIHGGIIGFVFAVVIAGAMAFAGYYATGEGVTLFVAAASSAECAKKTFLQQTPEYFHRGMRVKGICDGSSLEVSAFTG